MAYKWKGTTLAWGTNVAKMTGCRYRETGTQLDITSSESLRREIEIALLDDELTLTLLGTAFVNVVGDVAAVTVTWASGGSLSLGNCVITDRGVGGDVTTAVTTEITIKRTAQT